jgi:curved DNA-binding protein CbpA
VTDRVSGDPFAALGLATRPGLSDEDVRAAWRRIAAATHPDRDDGGDPARFGAAAAAYAELRTEFGRGEALADLAVGEPPGRRRRHGRRRRRSGDAGAPWRNGRYSDLNAMGPGSAAGGGRHRARRGPPAGRQTAMTLRRVTRLAGWRTRPAVSRDPDVPAAPGRTRARGYSLIHAARLVVPPRRPGGLAVRVVGAAAVGMAAIVIAGWSPGAVGVLAGLLTWLVAGARHALARRRSQ